MTCENHEVNVILSDFDSLGICVHVLYPEYIHRLAHALGLYFTCNV